jgi:hypothetical protein
VIYICLFLLNHVPDSIAYCYITILVLVNKYGIGKLDFENIATLREVYSYIVLLSKSMILLCLRHAARTRRDAPGAESKSLRDGIFDFHTPIHQRLIYLLIKCTNCTYPITINQLPWS